MSCLIQQAVRLQLCGALLSLLVAAPASASVDVYRCRVLGDPGACERLPAPADGLAIQRTVPGSYARYLIHNGRNFDQAIADARAIGEEPTVQIVRRMVQPKLSGIESYEQYVRGGPRLDDRRDNKVTRGSPDFAC